VTVASRTIGAAFAATLSVAVLGVQAQAPSGPPTYTFEYSDPACQRAALVSTGGPAPADSRTLAIRWIGYANFELAYNGQVLLLDAAFDRGSIFPPLGFKIPDINRVDAILIGHGHADHMSDAAAVAARTKAIVVGAAVTADKLLSQSVDSQQVRRVTGRGGELVELRGMKIEPILGRHSVRQTEITGPFEKALQSVSPPVTPAQAAEQKLINQRGVNDPRLATEGTITYLITLDTGFTVLFRDSAGDVTDFERAVMTRVGRVDVAIVASANTYVNTLASAKALEYARTYRPGVFIPAHHDAPYNDLWRSTEPMFQVMKDDNPNLITISKGYREPVCFRTGTTAGATR
jgi:L-ascorbate metabolism protein UlaG (beta-lactamase superfamily)